MNKKYLPFIIILLQLIFLSSMIGFQNNRLNNSTRVLLKTVPYDPLSIFRGHYANLRYEISSLPASLLKDADFKSLKAGDELFVELQNKGDSWQAEGIYRLPPAGGSGVYLRGRIPQYYYVYGGDQKDAKISLEYGIEAFFLNEKVAGEVDQASRGWGWQERERQERERIARLDPETQRIAKMKISRDWVKVLDNESGVWLKEGLITQELKDNLHNRYAAALDKLAAIEESLNTAQRSGQKPIIVEVAIGRNGDGSPTKLLFEGKEYR